MTIHLVFKDGYFHSDAESSLLMRNAVGTDVFIERSFDTISPRLVKMGYSIKVDNYHPASVEERKPIKCTGRGTSVKNPCLSCHLREVCGDGCGRKLFRLFTKK